jgi:hypothetical protein
MGLAPEYAAGSSTNRIQIKSNERKEDSPPVIVTLKNQPIAGGKRLPGCKMVGFGFTIYFTRVLPFCRLIANKFLLWSFRFNGV